MRPIFALLSVSFLVACASDRTALPVLPQALDTGIPHTVFVSTSRKREADGTFDFARSPKLSYQELTVSIPPSHVAGSLTYSHKNPDPLSDFTIAEIEEMSGVNDLSHRLQREQAQNGWPAREVTIFVHGYNTSHPEVAYRAAQIAHDVDLPGSILVYSWPSRGSAFGYAYDLDSMLFARDGLEETIRTVKKAGADRVVLVAHSMGTALAMETLRQAELKNPGWAARTLDGVMLISPDLSVDVFESQMDDIKVVPQPFGIMVSEKDQVLNLSARLRGTHTTQRLGTISSAEPLEKYPVEVIDLTEFSDDAATGHFVAASSPSLIALFRSADEIRDTLRPADTSLLGDMFPPTQNVQISKGKFVVTRPNTSDTR